MALNIHSSIHFELNKARVFNFFFPPIDIALDVVLCYQAFLKFTYLILAYIVLPTNEILTHYF